MAGGNEVSVSVGAGNTITVAVAGSTGTTPTITNGGTATVTVTSVGDRGPKGDVGPATTLTIGTVTGGATAAATLTGPAGAQVLNLTLPQGATGANIELQSTATHIQWRPVGGTTWTNLVALTAITGPQGSTGAAGSSVELQTTSTHIQWRLVGGTTWTNLVALTAITGPQGIAGPANSLTIGTVTTGAAGSNAAATLTGTAPNQTLNLTIPRGDAGTAGVSWQPVPMSPSASGTAGQIAYDNSFFYVRSADGWRRVSIATWTPLGAPTSVTATAGNAQATVSWTAPVDNGGYAITDYAVQFSSNGGTTWTTFADGTSTATTATVTGLTNGTDYVFRVAAVNSAGTGPYSSASSSVAPSSAASILPNQLAGLSGWWDASDSATLFNATTGGSSVAADGGVARWEDKSGNARHWTQSNSADRPLRKTAIKNSLDVVRFDSSSMLSSGWLLSNIINATQHTVFAVAVASSASSNSVNPLGNPAILQDDPGYSATGLFTFRSNGTVGSYGFDQFVSGGHVEATAAYTVGDWACLTSRHSSSSIVVRVNKIAGTASASIPSFGFQGVSIQLGSGYGGFFIGDLAELVVYNVALSAADRQAVETYLMNKWGIPQ